MAEYIYVAESPQYPGVVKIGRTDRSVHERMSELSADDYGMPGENIDSEWEAVKIIEVKDNEHAEAVLHEHFDHLRVTDSRELFYTDDPYGLAYEAAEVVDGTIMTADLIEIGNLFDPLSILALGAGITLLARTFAPENSSTKKAEKFMRDWELRTERRYKNADTKLGKYFFGGYKTIFKANKSLVEKTTGFVEGTAVLLGESMNSIGIKNKILKRLVDRKIKERDIQLAKNPPTIIRSDDPIYRNGGGASNFPDPRKNPNSLYNRTLRNKSTKKYSEEQNQELEKALKEELEYIKNLNENQD